MTHDELKDLLARVASAVDSFPEQAPQARFTLGCGYVRLAELTPVPDEARANWVLAKLGPGAHALAHHLLGQGVEVLAPQHPALREWLRISTPDLDAVHTFTLLLDRALAGPVVESNGRLEFRAAWQAPERVDTAAIAKIRDEGLNRSQVGAYFTTLVDTIGPRLAGSPQYKRAADWARDTLAKGGFTGVRLEPFEFGRGWQLDKFTLEMIEPRYMPLLGYPEAWSPATKGEVTATVAVVTGKSAEDVAKMPLTNAAVIQAAPVTNFIVSDRVQPAKQPDAPAAAAPTGGQGRGGQGGRQGGGRQGGAANTGAAGAPSPLTVDQAIRNGGAAVLLRPSRGMHGTVFVQAGRDNPNDLLPKVVLAGEHYNMLARMVQHGIPVKIRVNVHVLGTITQAEIIATLLMLGGLAGMWWLRTRKNQPNGPEEAH